MHPDQVAANGSLADVVDLVCKTLPDCPEQQVARVARQCKREFDLAGGPTDSDVLVARTIARLHP